MNGWDDLLRLNARYWGTVSGSPTAEGRCILVDLAHDSPVYVQRNLTVAKFVQLITGLPIVGFVAVPFDLKVDREAFRTHHQALARSFGVERFIAPPDVFEPDAPLSRESAALLARAIEEPDDRPLESELRERIRDLRVADGFPLGRYIADTFTRSELLPSLRGGPRLAFWVAQATGFAAWARTMAARERVEVFVTGHIDYLPWGALAEVVLAAGGRVVYQRTDGRANLFALNGVRSDLSLAGRCRTVEKEAFDAFETSVGAAADARAAAECALALEHGLGYNPLAGLKQEVEDRAPDDWRRHFFPRSGAAPIVCLFTHTFSDVCATDEGLFVDYLDWTEQCLDRAAGAGRCNLLVKVHPCHGQYDRSGVLDGLMSRYGASDNIAFFSAGPSRKALCEIADIGVTVRGTPGYETAAAGLPMAAGGKGFYTDVGVALESPSRKTHLTLFEGAIDGVRAAHDHARAQRYFAFTTRWARPTSVLMRPFGVYTTEQSVLERTAEAWLHRPEEDDVFIALRDAWSAGDAKVVCRKAALAAAA